MSDQLKDRIVAAIGNEFDIGEELGRGGMSIVYRALDLRLMRQVAVKVLPPEFAYDAGVRERFQREAQTAAQLSHPNIVPIFAVDERDGIAYFVMAVCEGESLALRLSRTKRPPLGEVRRILSEVADALAYAHSKGVVHRDIKPDNILIDRESGRAMVTDFGIARAAESGARLTVTGIAMGTPAYMSPEQALGEVELDGRSDIYSLGAVAYQMVTGTPPFTASNAPSLLLKHVSEELPPVASRRADVPNRLASLIERALEKKRERRWQSAADLRAALLDTNVLGVESGMRTPPPRNEMRPPPSTSPRRGSSAVAREFTAQRDNREPPAEGGWFEMWRREQQVVVNKRIRFLKYVAPWAAMLSAWTSLFMLALMVEYDDDAFMVWMMGIPPTLLANFLLVRNALWLRKRGIGFWDAIRARRTLSYQLPDRPDFALGGPQLEAATGPYGYLVRRALEDQQDIELALNKLPSVDRKMLPEVLPTVRALVDRVVTLVPTLHSLERDIQREDVGRLEQRIAELEMRARHDPGSERTLQLLRRQQASLIDLANRRDVLQAQIESASLLLQNIKLDLLKVSSSGVEASMSDVYSATQEARALSREIGNVLSVADDMRKL